MTAGGIVALSEFASDRDLTFDANADLSDASPLLLPKMDEKRSGVVTGELAPGLDAKLAIGQLPPLLDNTPPRFITRIEGRVPESIGVLPILTCRESGKLDLGDRAFGPRGVYKLQREVTLESIALGRRFVIGVANAQDENWVRQLFSPTFVDYLAERAPEDCNFEIYQGVLVVATTAEPDAATLNSLCEFAGAVAERLRSEALEGEGLGGRSWRGADDEKMRRWEASQEEDLAEVEFDRLPDSVGAAAERFNWRVRRMPVVWISSFVIGALVGLVIVGIPFLLIVPFWDFLAESDPPLGTIAPFAGLIFAVITLWFTQKIVRGQIESRTTTLGFEAFIRAYAGERELELIDGQRFHSEHVRAEVAGVAQRALRGVLPGSAREATLVIAKDQATRTKAQFDYSMAVFDGQRMVATSAETPVRGWTPATLDEFCADSATGVSSGPGSS